MFDPKMQLVSSVLAQAVADDAGPGAWAEARQALQLAVEKNPELVAAVEAEDTAALTAIVAAWASDKRLLPESDRGVLKRAIKAYRKSLKVKRLDAESSIAGGPMSAGRESSILGIRPPDRYPREVWDELARQGRLIDAKQGMYELPPE